MHGLIDDFDVSAADVAKEIDVSGTACLIGVVTEEWLTEARECVDSYLPMHGRHGVYIKDPAANKGSFAHQLVTDHRIESLVKALAVAGCPRLNTGRQGIDSALRILVGPGPRRPLLFHYDSTVVTMVVPITVPDAGAGTSGELILCPNRRPYRRFVITNIVEKFVLQTDLYRKRFVRKLGKNRDVKVVKLEPGNAYLFWGYRAFHATLPCAPGALRATLMLHYGELHSGDPLLATSKTLSKKLRALR